MCDSPGPNTLITHHVTQRRTHMPKARESRRAGKNQTDKNNQKGVDERLTVKDIAQAKISILC